MLIVYVDVKKAPNLGKKCYEFLKLPYIFLILSFRKFTGGYEYLQVSCYNSWYFLNCENFLLQPWFKLDNIRGLQKIGRGGGGGQGSSANYGGIGL